MRKTQGPFGFLLVWAEGEGKLLAWTSALPCDKMIRNMEKWG